MTAFLILGSYQTNLHGSYALLGLFVVTEIFERVAVCILE